MLLVASIAAAAALAQETAPAGAETCVWEAQITPATTADGHRLLVVFLDTEGKVRLSLGEDVISDRMLQTVPDGTGYSGAMQCRLAGRQRLTVSAFDQERSVLLHMDEPNRVIVRAESGRIWIDVEQTDRPPLLD